MSELNKIKVNGVEYDIEDTTARTGNPTAQEKATWNAKSDFSGNYNDLTNKPTIPTTLAQLTDDSTHRTVTDAEKTVWNAGGGGGLSSDAKTALLNCFANVAWANANGSTYYDALEDALNPVTSISAVYTGGSVVEGTALSSLTGITVTATRQDGTSAAVTGYTLSGTIAVGNNTITVTYKSKTTTFVVVGTAAPATLESITAVYTGGDVVEGTALSALTGITVTAHYDDETTAVVTGYTLSGTIAVGTNTITVTYQSKTTTFTVVGTASPSSWDVEWLASSGTLPDNAGFTKNTSGVTSQTLESGYLQIVNELNSGSDTSYTFYSPASYGTTTHGELEIEFEYASIPDSNGIRLQVSNGSGAAQGFVRSISSEGKYFAINPNTRSEAIPANTRHTISAKLINGQATYKLDGVDMSFSTSLSTQYATQTRIYFQSLMNVKVYAMRYREVE